jgi:type IV pilus assembly protein PilA
MALVAVAGCGSGSSKKAGPSGEASSPQVAMQDAAAKADARNLLTEVVTCFTTSQDYSQCSTASQLRSSGGGTASSLPIGKGRGQVEVSGATATGFTIVGHSQSGTDFTVTGAPSGAVKRTCSKPANGGCPAGGAW